MQSRNIININRNIGNISVAFTPSFYKRAYKNYLNGDYRDLFALIDRAEVDSFIAGCLFARHSGYKRKYQLLPASQDKHDLNVADWLKGVLEQLSMREFFEDMIDARLKYYSVIGLEWDVVDGFQVPVYAEKFDPKYFKYDPADNILKIDGGKSLSPIPADSAFIVEATRNPIMLTVLKDYIRKEFGEESWSSFLEVFGEPFIYAEYPAGSSPEQIKQTEEGVNKIASSARGVLPEGSKFHLEATPRNTGDHKSYVDDCKSGISFALLGHEEAAGSDKKMQIGDSQSSMQATKKITEDDMYWLEDKITPFFKMIINRNFNVKAYPRLLIDKSDIIDPKTKLEAANIAFENGAEIDPAFFKEYGIPIVSSAPLKKQSAFGEFGDL